MAESVREASTGDSWSNYDTEIDSELLLNIEVPTSPEPGAVPAAEVFGFQTVDKVDEIKEIDEQLLEELDSVGDFRVKEFRELDDPVQFGSQVYRMQHDAESSSTLFEGNLTRVHAAEQLVHTEKLGWAIKEFDQYDEDMKHVSGYEIPRSAVDLIDPLNYDGIRLDDSGHLQLTEETIYSKAKQKVTEVNSLEEISDIEDNDLMMAEIEAHFAKTIEGMIIEAELTSAKTGVLHIDPLPSFIDLELEETSTAAPESMAMGKTRGEAKDIMETREIQDLGLDLNQHPEDNVEQVRVSGSVLSADDSKDIEGTFPELLVSERKSLNDSNSTLNQESRSSSSEALGLSEDGTGENIHVQAVLDSSRDSKSVVEVSDVMKTLQHSLEEPDIIQAKSPESDDVLISERKYMDESFSALKQASQSSPSEALKMSEDVGVYINLPSKVISGDEEPDVKKNDQMFLEEPYSNEPKTYESHNVLVSERNFLYDSFSALKQESQSYSTEALKMSEDVGDNIYSPSEEISSAEAFDVKKTQQNFLEEPYSVEAKTPESHDVLISETQSLNDSGSALKKESQSSPSEALKFSLDDSAKNVQEDTDFPREAKAGAEESDVKDAQQNHLEEPYFLEVKTPKCHDMAVSDAGNNTKVTDTKSSSSSSSSSDSDKE